MGEYESSPQLNKIKVRRYPEITVLSEDQPETDSFTTISELTMKRNHTESPVIIEESLGSVQSMEEENGQKKKSIFQRYQWRMTHYFYIHLCYFLFNGFVGALIIWLIENYSSTPNPYMKLSYLDAWFTTVSTICSCGLTTVDFGQLSQASQIIMMFYAFISGFAVSTLPALVIKARSHRNSNETNVDDDNDGRKKREHEELHSFDIRKFRNIPPDVQAKFDRLPTPGQLRYRAYITCIILIVCIYATVYISGFISMGIWLHFHNTDEYLLQNNRTLSPWYVSGMLTLFSFNQNGLTPFSTSLSRYVSDVYLNIVLVLVREIVNINHHVFFHFHSKFISVSHEWFIFFSHYFEKCCFLGSTFGAMAPQTSI